MMNTQNIIVATLIALIAAPLALAAPTIQPTRAGAVPDTDPPAAVARALSDISPDRLRQYVDKLASFGTRHTLSETESSTRGIGAARRWTKRAFEEAVADSGRTGDLACNIYLDRHIQPPDNRRITREVEIVNVVCEIPGSQPAANNRYYYVLAHLDSRASSPTDAESDAPGANDSASGVAMMIEAARHLSRARTDATIVLMATSGEEQGLYGAQLHARDIANRGRDIHAVLNNDTVGDPYGKWPKDSEQGRAARKTIRVFSQGVPPNATPGEINRAAILGAESDSDARQIARYMSMVAHWHDLPVKPALIFRNDRFLRGGDHTAFLRAGYDPSVRVTVPYEDYNRQHQDVRTENGTQYGDLAKYIDENYMADITRLNSAALLHLANAPRKPANARLITADLTTDTTIRWDKSPEPDVAGYEIVFRRTTSPVWEESIDVGDTTEATIDYSKDNWLFGVRAYDEDGYRSPVAFPGAAQE